MLSPFITAIDAPEDGQLSPHSCRLFFQPDKSLFNADQVTLSHQSFKFHGGSHGCRSGKNADRAPEGMCRFPDRLQVPAPDGFLNLRQGPGRISQKNCYQLAEQFYVPADLGQKCAFIKNVG